MGISSYPNVTVDQWGSVKGDQDGGVAMMAEIHTRGPIACMIDAEPILNYTGGIVTNKPGPGGKKNPGCHQFPDHIVSVVGWGEDNGQKYWEVRNSWGEFWGEMGYVRVGRGENDLCLELQCSWATPRAWTESNVPCHEGGDNCAKPNAARAGVWVDPATSGVSMAQHVLL